MSILRWFTALVLCLVTASLANILLMITLDLSFTHLNYWLAATISIIAVLLVSSKIGHWVFFMIPYIIVKVTTMSLYYLMLFNVVATIVFQSLRNDFHLDNNIPKWVHVLFPCIVFICAYSVKKFAENIAYVNGNLNRRATEFSNDKAKIEE